MGRGELQHQVRCGNESGLDTCHHRAVSQGLGQVTLAHTAGPQEHDVLGALNKGQRSQFLDLARGAPLAKAKSECSIALMQGKVARFIKAVR